MYRILIAMPDGDWPGYPGLDANADVCRMFNSDKMECFGSMDPADVDNCDGIIMPGAPPDVSARYYGEEDLPTSEIDEQFDEAQMAILKRGYELHKPMLGVCRGHQMMAVLMGATTIQSITGTDAHQTDLENPRFHYVRNVPGTFMYELYGESMIVNSAHHQAVRDIPENFRVSQIWCKDESKYDEYVALAAEGKLREGTSEVIIEAVCSTDYPFIGLQWHPEVTLPGFECTHLDTSKITDYFLKMVEDNK